MNKLIVVFFALVLLMTKTAIAQNVPSPLGLWLTQNERSVVSIKECDKGLCGQIYWIIKDGMKTDSKNPNPKLRTQPLCGLEILYNFKQHQKNKKVWEDGKIYKADEGDIYNATLTALDEKTLRLRGYVGVPLFGKTQLWTRVSEKDYPRCK